MIGARFLSSSGYFKNQYRRWRNRLDRLDGKELFVEVVAFIEHSSDVRAGSKWYESDGLGKDLV